VQYRKLVIKAIHEEVKGFKTFTFEDGHGIVYQPGQYLTFVHTTSLEEIRRSYSIISVPQLNDSLAIGVKRIPNGAFSRRLTDHGKPGDILYTTGAAGFFVLPENISDYQQIFFLAAGSGITPIYALIKQCLHFHPHLDVILIYSNASAARTVFHNQLNALQRSFPNTFHLQFLFSDYPHLNKARLNKELLTELLDQFLKTEKSKTVFYTCGPEAYMRMCTYTLQEEKIPKENIRRENFSIEKLHVPKAEPPDKNPHEVKIHYGGAIHEFIVQYPDTILKAARKHNIILPYSCETGRCGNCAAKCLKGKIWLSYNEVLTEKELGSGITLTCVGYPVGGDVELEIV
jgi:ferredoxin-NADP reductase